MGRTGGPSGPPAPPGRSSDEDFLGCGIDARLGRELGMLGRARARARPNRLAASLLLSGNVPAAADRRPVEPCVDAGFGDADLFHGRLLVAPTPRRKRRQAIDRGGGLRLSTGLLAGWTLGHLYVVPRRGTRALGARFGERRHACADQQWRRQRGTALLAGRQAHRVRLDAVQPALSHFYRRFRCGHAPRIAAPDRRAQERPAALLLQ